MKIINITEVAILFDNGTSVIDHHDQSCCEHVYADWLQLKDTDIKNIEFDNKIIIIGVPESGFKLVSSSGLTYFIPCYNEQNGYYDDNLELEVKYPDGSKRIVDICLFTKFVERG